MLENQKGGLEAKKFKNHCTAAKPGQWPLFQSVGKKVKVVPFRNAAPLNENVWVNVGIAQIIRWCPSHHRGKAPHIHQARGCVDSSSLDSVEKRKRRILALSRILTAVPRSCSRDLGTPQFPDVPDAYLATVLQQSHSLAADTGLSLELIHTADNRPSINSVVDSR